MKAGARQNLKGTRLLEHTKRQKTLQMKKIENQAEIRI